MHNHLLLYNFTSQGQFHDIIYDVTSQLKEKKKCDSNSMVKAYTYMHKYYVKYKFERNAGGCLETVATGQ